MPFWHKDYFELTATEIQEMQKEAFLELPFSDEKQILLRKFDSIKTEGQQWDGPAQTNLIPLDYSPNVFTCPQFDALGSLKPVPLSLLLFYKFIIFREDAI